MASHRRCHNLWTGLLGEQVCAGGLPCLSRQGPQVTDTHATTAAATTGQVTEV